MELRDLIVAPLVLFVVYAVAYFLRPSVTDSVNRRYFIPALTAKIVGALAVGFIYQFYYSGGDTFAYHTHGSRHIWELMMESPSDGLRLLFSSGEIQPGIWRAARKIWFFRDPHSFYVVQVAAFFDLFTFSSYSGTAILFAVFSFVGGWMLFLTFYQLYPKIHRSVAFSVLFIPTVVFWGSGIFKDSLTLAALGIATYSFYRVFILNKIRVMSFLALLLAAWMIFSIKKYILLTFLPALLIWWYLKKVGSIRSQAVKMILSPMVGGVVLVVMYFGVNTISESDARYNINNLAKTARMTAYDIRYGWGARTGEGSGYTLGELDGTWQSMIRLAPAGINVSLFRPYLWEVRNPLMLLSALESLMLLVATLFVLVKAKSSIGRYFLNSDVLFCLVFALVFAFAVGVSTFNFGTLSRYKIPLLPYYSLALSIIYFQRKSERKLEVLATTE